MDNLNNKFDRMLRKQLNAERFEFREEYWAEASGMIKAGRRFILRRWIGYGLVILTAGIAALMWLTPGKTDQLTANDTKIESKQTTSNTQNSYESKISGKESVVENNKTEITASKNSSSSINEKISQTGETSPVSQIKTKHASVQKSDEGKSNINSPTKTKSNKVLPKLNTVETRKQEKRNEINESKNTKNLNRYAWNLNDILLKGKYHFSFGEISDLWDWGGITYGVPALGPLIPGPKRKLHKPLLVALQFGTSVQEHRSNATVQAAPLAGSDSVLSPAVIESYRLRPGMHHQLDIRLQKGAWGIQAGIATGSIKEDIKFAGIKEVAAFDTSFNLINTSYGPNGNYWLLKQQVDSSSAIVENEAFNPTFKNEIRYIEFPFGAFYEQAFNNRWSILVGAGLTVRKPISGNYAIIDEENNGIQYLQAEQLAFIQNYYVNSQLNYRLNSQLDLFARTSFTSHMGPNPNRNRFRYSSRNYGLGLTYWLKN